MCIYIVKQHLVSESLVVYAKIYVKVDDYGGIKSQGGNSEYKLSDVVKIQLHGVVNEDAGLHGSSGSLGGCGA